MTKLIKRKLQELRLFIINIPSIFPRNKMGESLIIVNLLLLHPLKCLKNLWFAKKTLNILKNRHPQKYINSKKALYSYSMRVINTEKCKEFLNVYSQCNVEQKQKYIKPSQTCERDPIMICCVKNDLLRVQLQVEHHKYIGVKNFVYVDNYSEDGTYEWLLQQDVDVYRTNDKFSATAKNAWIRHIIDIYGYNRWYLILDSDELFTYPYCEERNIQKLVELGEKYKIQRFQSFLIDMYARKPINYYGKNETMEDYDIKLNINYFDTNTYYFRKDYRGPKIQGGPRERIFSKKRRKFSPILTKNSLLYVETEDMFGVHYSIPYYKTNSEPIFTGLLHYKFLPDDSARYAKIAREGNYSNNSAEYKRYLELMEKQGYINFHFPDSTEYKDSTDLLKINIIDKSFAEKIKNE